MEKWAANVTGKFAWRRFVKLRKSKEVCSSSGGINKPK